MSLRESTATAAYLAAAGATVIGATVRAEGVRMHADSVHADAIHADSIHTVAKSMLMPILGLRAHAWRQPLLLTGLVAATVGDIAMIDPDDDRRFTLGASCFAVTQVCWSTLLWRSGSRFRARHVVPRAAGWAGAAVLAHRTAPAVATVSALYGLALGTMSSLGADGSRRAVVGSTLFTLSDASILLRRSLPGGKDGGADRARRAAEGVVLITYCAAQYALTDSFRLGVETGDVETGDVETGDVRTGERRPRPRGRAGIASGPRPRRTR